MIDLAVIEARAAAAFRGPWTYTRFEVVCDYHCEDGAHEVVRVESPDEYPDGQVVADVLCDVPGLEGFAQANGEFIAHARTDIPALLAEVKRLRDEQRDLRVWLEEACHLAFELYPYVDKYFVEKWGYDESMDKLRNAWPTLCLPTEATP